jgi:hypothetical protein
MSKYADIHNIKWLETEIKRKERRLYEELLNSCFLYFNSSRVRKLEINVTRQYIAFLKEQLRDAKRREL